MKKEHDQVKIKRYAGTEGNFLSHALYRDPCFDFMYLLTDQIDERLTDEQIYLVAILFYITYMYYLLPEVKIARDLCSVHGIRSSHLCLHTF